MRAKDSEGLFWAGIGVFLAIIGALILYWVVSQGGLFGVLPALFVLAIALVVWGIAREFRKSR